MQPDLVRDRDRHPQAMIRYDAPCMRYRLLDVFRGFAALWVFTYHIDRPTSLPRVIEAWCARGDLGVPVFFVISGYCMMASLRSAVRRDERPLSFLSRRMRRIYPTYWSAIAVAIAVPYAMAVLTGLKTGGYVTPRPQFVEYDAFAWAGMVTLLRVFTPGFDNIFWKFSPLNAVFWSLAIEVQFYFVMAAAVWARGRALALLGFVTVVGALLIPLHNSYVWGIFLPYFPMFSLGFVLFLLLEKGYSPRKLFGEKATVVALAAPLVAIGGFYALLPIGLLTPPSLAFAAVATVVLWFCHGLDPLADAPLSRPLAFVRKILLEVGAMSYSIYLIHLMLMLLVIQIMRQVISPERAFFPFVCIAVTVPCCYPFYWLCERPFVKAPAAAPAPKAEPVEVTSLSR